MAFAVDERTERFENLYSMEIINSSVLEHVTKQVKQLVDFLIVASRIVRSQILKHLQVHILSKTIFMTLDFSYDVTDEVWILEKDLVKRWRVS